jgi:hypothetical protein
MVDTPESDVPDNLVLRYLRAMDAKLDRVIVERAEDHSVLIRVVESLANVRKEMALTGEHLAHFEVRFDDLRQSVDRINVRLGLVSG